MGITNRHHHKFLATRGKSNPLPSMYGKFTYIYHKINQMYVNIPYMDRMGGSVHPGMSIAPP